jgi:hypothetical protein
MHSHIWTMNWKEVCTKCGRAFVHGVCLCGLLALSLPRYGDAPPLPSHDPVVVKTDGEGSKGPVGGAPPIPDRAVSAIASAGATGAAGTHSFTVYDETTGEVRSAVWPHGKPERALGPTGPAGADSGIRFGATGPTGPK